LFKNRDKNLIADIIPKLAPLKIKKGYFIYHKNEIPNKIYILFKGRVAVMYDNKTVMKMYGQGAYFGEIEIFKNTVREYSLRTLEDCELMIWNKDEFLGVLQHF
jgi:CRP-like cAMP-binding protein